ncbi:hypothetical protein NDU88_007611, partial [Pleurodeles waltl]
CTYLLVTCRPCPTPSVKAACADAAVCDPEWKEEETRPLWVPGLKGVWRATRVPENAVQEEQRTADESAEDARVWECNDGQQKRPPVQNPEAKEGEDVSRVLTAVQEAHREDSSHTSGEAWHRQVRP